MNYMGGSFEFTPEILALNIIGEANEQIGIAEEELCLTRSGRSGIALVLQSWHKNLSEGWILMPDYQCWDVLTVFDDIKKKYISVNDKLKLEMSELKEFLLDKNLRGVFLIDYFGLSDLQPYIELIKSRRPDVLIIIDAVQAFLSLVLSVNRYSGADVIISSPRKFLPIPDGGLVISKNEHSFFIKKNNKNHNLNKQISYYITAGVLRNTKIKNLFDEETSNVLESLYLDLFENHRKLFDNKVEPISPLSLEIIKRSDLRAIAKKRLKSFKWVSDSLKHGNCSKIISPIYTEKLGPGLVFPVRVNLHQRDSLRNYLKSKGYFCPVHWPIQEKQLPLLGESSKRLSKEILGLPIDQRYDLTDLSKLLDEINMYNKAYNL